MASDEPRAKRQKLARLPDAYKVEKRPLLRPSIASRFAGSDTPKVVYVSTKMPFMAAVKRVQKLLAQVEKREAQSATAQVRNGGHRGRRSRDDADDVAKIAAVMARKKVDAETHSEQGDSEVVVKATGKAVEKALGLALWFQQRDEYRITIKTGSAGAIDDIVSKGSPAPQETDVDAVVGEAEGDGNEPAANHRKGSDTLLEEPPESRIRFTSVIEVFVSKAS